MKFAFNRFNHGRQGRIIVEDITRIMAAQIAALGHEATDVEEGPFIAGDLGYNIILEAFDEPAHVAMMADAKADGCRFIIVATEKPTDEGFNGGFDPAMRRRQDLFPIAAKHADAILHLVPGEDVTRWYGQFAPAAAAELGHAPSLVDIVPDVQPDFDFGFYGKMTWRRSAMLDRLERLSGKKVLRIETLDVPRQTRDEMMRRCRVIVQILAEQTTDGVPCGMVSSTRCATALSFGRPILAEPHPDPWPWDDVVDFCESIEAFYENAMAATKIWRELHANQFLRFAVKLNPEFCVGAPLRSLGII